MVESLGTAKAAVLGAPVVTLNPCSAHKRIHSAGLAFLLKTNEFALIYDRSVTPAKLRR
jgi:hypothetical protein